ncbi:MAG: hypothetical protein ACFFC7_17865, partial [Candidatus Hermodarchaeota archaeon]
MHITLKIPLMSDRLTRLKQLRLESVTGRDTTLIKRYLEVISQEDKNLRRIKKNGTEEYRIDKEKLDALTLTSRPLRRKKKKTGEVIEHPGRSNVKYDLKKEFGKKITARELKECRDTAVEMYHSYLDRVEKHEATYWKIVRSKKYEEREEELAETLHWWKTEKRPTPPCSQTDYQPRKLPRRATLGTTMWVHTKIASKLTHYWLEIYYPT